MSEILDVKKKADLYKKVFLGSDEGKAVLADLLQHGNVMASAFHELPHRMAVNVGRQELALYIANLVGCRVDFVLEQIERRSTKQELYKHV